MKKYNIILNVIIPPLACILSIIFFDKLFYYLPLIFGLVIGISNWKLHKYKPYLGVFLSVLVLYIAYSLTILSFSIYEPIWNFLKENINYIISKEDVSKVGFILSPFIIAPLLVFYAYRFVFNIPKTKITFWVIATFTIFLALQSYILFNKSDYFSTQFKDYKLFNPYVVWQPIMALGLQLILYQKELIFLYKNK